MVKPFKFMAWTVALVCSLAAPASAGVETWTPWFMIQSLDNGDGTTDQTYAVRAATGNLTTNPAGCSSLTHAFLIPSATATSKDLTNRTLLAALLSGREVRLRIHGTACTQNSPTFGFVNIR